ncbi:hypothetical protein DFR70_10591 [Nocardia tenerifensis]|uniref:Uncharacterized protein n=1 Tax=Nocardia tenerifensis TaxID=228006 RepID=A0A318JZM2_9NOCA|nr:hypothetical protein [Nocardia tenerifensis]PXX63909.1 hypothetical protein DFR70_10591 [Nocardia tenerifensis]
MLYAFGFDRLGLLISDMYFVNPAPAKGQEGPEHGVRLELRRLTPRELEGSIYSARPITIDEPIWRADLLESVDGRPGSFDRTHHHPRFYGWNESNRAFEAELSADPIGWLGRKLSDLPSLLAHADVDPDTVGPGDLDGLPRAVPEILEVTRRLLDRVRAGELGCRPVGAPADNVRASWL